MGPVAASLDEQKSVCEDESKQRSGLLAKFRNLEHEYDGLRDHYDEEQLNRENLTCLHQGRKMVG